MKNSYLAINFQSTEVFSFSSEEEAAKFCSAHNQFGLWEVPIQTCEQAELDWMSDNADSLEGSNS